MFAIIENLFVYLLQITSKYFKIMQKNNEGNHNDRQNLKQELKWGDIGKIAKVADTSRSSVERWFNGDYDSTYIESAVKQLIKTRKEKLNQLIKDQA